MLSYVFASQPRQAYAQVLLRSELSILGTFTPPKPPDMTPSSHLHGTLITPSHLCARPCQAHLRVLAGILVTALAASRTDPSPTCDLCTARWELRTGRQYVMQTLAVARAGRTGACSTACSRVAVDSAAESLRNWQNS